MFPLLLQTIISNQMRPRRLEIGYEWRLDIRKFVLVPLLFLIFINDLDLCVLSPILKFADDTNIFS